MIKRDRRPAPPGKILKLYYLEPRNLSVSRFAQAAGLSRKHVSNIVNDKAPVTSETAVRIAAVLDTTAQFWLNLQNAVDIFDAEQRLKRWRPHEVHGARAAE